MINVFRWFGVSNVRCYMYTKVMTGITKQVTTLTMGQGSVGGKSCRVVFSFR